jgi:hypothetical protein
VTLAAFLSAEEPAVWKAGPPLFAPGPAGSFDETAVKDPSIVFAGGLWRLFYTARGRGLYTIGYAAARSLPELASARRYQLPQLRGEKENYAAAPQVFYFRPQKQWYLIYQTTDGWYQPVFSTTRDIDKPESWSRPKPLVAHPEKEKWIDFWVICDETKAYLFFTRSHREVVVMTTALADFPAGFANPRVVLSPLIEAAHVYRVEGTSPRYQMLFEIPDGSLRKYGRATAATLLGPWRTDTTDYAAGRQLTYDSSTPRWTDEVSHGELLRTGIDERLEVAAHPVQFLIQGMRSAQHQGEYPALPWRLGLITR